MAARIRLAKRLRLVHNGIDLARETLRNVYRITTEECQKKREDGGMLQFLLGFRLLLPGAITFVERK